MLLAHLPSGYLLAYANEKLLRKKSWSLGFAKKLVLLSVIGAGFPDIDTLPFLLDRQGLSMHREYLTHTPLPYLLLLVVIYYVGGTMNKKNRGRLYLMGWAFVSGVFLHLVTDSMFGRIRWLYPLSDAKFSVYPISQTTSGSVFDWAVEFLTSVYFLPELVIFAVTGWLYWKVRFARE